MSEEIKLTLEQQFSIAQVNTAIDCMTHEQLKDFAKMLYKESVCRAAMTNHLLKVQWGLGNESK